MPCVAISFHVIIGLHTLLCADEDRLKLVRVVLLTLKQSRGRLVSPTYKGIFQQEKDCSLSSHNRTWYLISSHTPTITTIFSIQPI
jgi:hypothetical protein